MGLVHDLDLLDENGEIASVTETVIDTQPYAENCAALFGDSKVSTVYLLARVDYMRNRLYVSAEGKIVGTIMPRDERLTAGIIRKTPEPTLAMGELFESQYGWAIRLHFHRSLVR